VFSVGSAGATAALAAGQKFRVKYRSMGNVYLEGGRADGLGVGDRLRVQSGAEMVGELEVVYAAEHSASCRVVSESRPVKSGDQAAAVSSRPAIPAADALADPKPASSGSRAVASSAASTVQRAVRQPFARDGVGATARRRLDRVLPLVGRHGVRPRLRAAHRTGRPRPRGHRRPAAFPLAPRSKPSGHPRTHAVAAHAQNERNDRLYELALRYDPPSDALQFELGRVGIHNFVGVGYLDGGIVRLRVRPRLRVGAFGGRAADYEGFGFASEGSKYGAFVTLSPGGRYATGGYDIALAFVKENAEGDVSREYVSLESRFGSGSRWSLFQRAELDVNRGWRKELSASSVQLSNVSLSGNLRLSSSSNLFVSYDGRRNFRYFQNRIVPEEVFDDLLHQGLRAGVNLFRPGGFGATAGVGVSLKEEDPRHPELNIANAYSFNGGVRHANLLGGLSLGLDASGFSNGYTDGGLLSLRVGRRFGAGHMLDFSWGRRSTGSSWTSSSARRSGSAW
jgi:hypothetical protein